MKSYDYRNSMEFLRTNVFIEQDYLKSGGFPFVYKQNVDVKDLQFIGFDKASSSPLLGGGFNKNQKTVHFFLDDYKFDEVWNSPEKQAKKLLNYKQVLGPDFSVYANMPTVLQQYNVFKSRWCCAYWQQLGMAVIPTITWGASETFEWCFKGVEKGSVLAIATVGTYAVEDEFMDGYKEMCKQLEPTKIINYGKVYSGMRDFVEVIDYPYNYIQSPYNDNEFYEGGEDKDV